MLPFASVPSLRIDPENPNHHLWKNHGTWFLHYTTYPTPFTKQRIRRSLQTRNVQEARERRDLFFETFLADLSRNATAPCDLGAA